MLQKQWIFIMMAACTTLAYIYPSQKESKAPVDLPPHLAEIRSYEPPAEKQLPPPETTVVKAAQRPTLPALKDLLELYSQYDAPKLNELLTETQLQIEKGDYIARANTGELSNEERLKLTEYIRTENAIHIVQTKALLEKLKSRS